jgi:hypothetical protein
MKDHIYFRHMNKEKKKIALDGKRIALTSSALKILELEVKRIKEKGPYYKLNESKLASAIVELFSSKYLKKECKEIEDKFFDKKLYLKMMIEQSGSEVELENSISNFLKSQKTKTLPDG